MRFQRGSPRTILSVALLLLVGSVVPMQATAQVDLPFEPPNPDPILDRLLLEDLRAANRTWNEANEAAPNHQAIGQAAVELNRAARFYESGDLHLTLEGLRNFHAAVSQAIWETETEDSSDQDAAIYTRSRDLFEDTVSEVDRLHERLGNIERGGVDPWLLDRTLHVGDVLAEGQLALFTYGEFDRGWNNDNREQQVRLGLIAWSNAAAWEVELATALLSESLAEAPEAPTGPVVSNETLHARLEVWVPQIEHLKRSFDQQLTNVVNDNLEANRTLASLGAMVTLVRQQPSAVAQHMIQEEAFSIEAEEAVATLEDALRLPETLHALDDVGDAGVSNSTYLRAALQSYNSAANRLADANGTGDEHSAILTAGSGLGYIASHRFAASLLLQAHGEAPLEPLFWLPGDDVHAEANDHGDDHADEDRDIPWRTLGIWFLVVLLLIVIAARWLD